MPSDSTTTTPDETPTGDRLLVVEVRGALYGLDSTAVREIVPLLPATRLPGAPPHVRGVVNLRGQLLTVVDLGQRLTGDPMASPDGSTVVVLAGERSLGVLVDDVHEVQVVPVEAAGQDVLARGNGVLGGLGRLGEEVVLVIDIPELVRQTLA